MNMWCGTAMIAAFANPPPDVPQDQLDAAKAYIDGGNKLIDDARKAYLAANSTEQQIATLQADLLVEVTAALQGSIPSKHTFAECAALIPGLPPPPGGPAPEASSSAAQ